MKGVKYKKGWMRILEAFLSIIIVTSALLTITSTSVQNIDRSDFFLDKQKQILQIVVSNDSLRNKIISGDLTDIKSFVSKNIPGNWNYSLSLCNYDEFCNQSFPINQEVYVSDTIITANSTDYQDETIRRLKLSIWIK